MTGVQSDSSHVAMEVYMFETLDAQGRFIRIEEITLLQAGSEADRGMGNAR